MGRDEVKPFDSPAHTDIDPKNLQTPKEKTDKKEDKPNDQEKKDQNTYTYRRY